MLFSYFTAYVRYECQLLNCSNLDKGQNSELTDMYQRLQTIKRSRSFLWYGDIIQIQAMSITGKILSVSYIVPICYIDIESVPTAGVTHWPVRFEILASENFNLKTFKSCNLSISDFNLSVVPGKNICVWINGSYEDSLSLELEDARQYKSGGSGLPFANFDLFAATRDSDLYGPVETNGEIFLSFTIHIEKEQEEYKGLIQFCFLGNVK